MKQQSTASKRILLIAAALLVGAPAVSSANGYASGRITYFVPFVYNGIEMFAVRLTQMSSPPSCATNNRFVMSSADPKYKTTLAMMLGAYFSGSPIFIRGQGTCTLYDSASEDFAYSCLGSDPC